MKHTHIVTKNAVFFDSPRIRGKLQITRDKIARKNVLFFIPCVFLFKFRENRQASQVGSRAASSFW